MELDSPLADWLTEMRERARLLSPHAYLPSEVLLTTEGWFSPGEGAHHYFPAIDVAVSVFGVSRIGSGKTLCGREKSGMIYEIASGGQCRTCVRLAQGIEAAAAAETRRGSVHESPVAEGHAP